MGTTLAELEQTDEELAAEAAREGSDGPAFVDLMRRHQERIWRICYRLMDNAEDASDAAQEVLVRMFVARHKFSGLSRYTTWLHAIAVRTCLSLRRGRGRRQRHESLAQQEQIAQQRSQVSDEGPRQSLDLREMLGILEEEDRAILILKYGEGYSHEELSEMFQISVSACKMRISRACAKLRGAFPEQRFDDEESP
ncbi:MAG: RNA polymerase sigma factor [Planctomycetes bacterium]|nr:RNA polymerase sigma factor [Planctomycetota bacterium]